MKPVGTLSVTFYPGPWLASSLQQICMYVTVLIDYIRHYNSNYDSGVFLMVTTQLTSNSDKCG